MSPELEKKIAAILLYLDYNNPHRRGPSRDHDWNIQHMLDHPDVAAWLMVCKQKGYGNANIFTMVDKS